MTDNSLETPHTGAQVYLADPYHPVTVYSDEQARATWVEVPSGHAGQAGYDHKPANRLRTTTDGQGRFRFEAAEIPLLNRKQGPGLTPPATRAFGPESFAVVVASEKGFAHVMPEEFAAAVDRRAGKLAKAATFAIAMIKDAVRRGYDLPLDEGLDIEAANFARAALSNDAAIGIMSFLAKQEPEFTGS